jgi:hypothetical protein
MEKFFKLDEFLTPTIIKYAYWAALAYVIMLGLTLLRQGGPGILFGMLYLVIAPIGVRISAELALVLFRIYDELRMIRQAREDDAASPR